MHAKNRQLRDLTVVYRIFDVTILYTYLSIDMRYDISGKEDTHSQCKEERKADWLYLNQKEDASEG